MNERSRAPKLSVIIPVAHAEVNLPKIEKMIIQGISYPVQFVIVHDIMNEQESMGLINLVNSYSNPEVIMVSVRAGNAGSARNSGLKLSTGSWISFWDSDDEANLVEMMELIDRAELENFEVCIGSYQAVSKEIVINHILNPRTGLNQIANNPGIWRFCIRSEIAHTADFPAIQMGEDQIYLLQLNLPMKRILFSESIVYRYIYGQPHQVTYSKSSREEIKESLMLAIETLVSSKNCDTAFTRNIVVRQAFTTLKVCGFRNLMSALFSKKANLNLAHFLKLLPTFFKVAFKIAGQKMNIARSRIRLRI